jgi:large subunit ribosomal protein L9e
MAAKYHINNI